MVAPHYDPLIAKLITWGADREQAIQRMRRALLEYAIGGITSNIPYHLAILEEPDFAAGRLSTHFIGDHPALADRARHWVERKRELDSALLRSPAQVAAIAGAVAVTL